MKKAIFLPVLAFAIFLLVLYGLVPALVRIQSLSKEVKDEASDLEQKKQYFVDLQAIAAGLDENKTFWENIERALPVEFSMPSLMNYFQLTAAENGLLLRNFSYEDTPASNANQANGSVSEKESNQPVSMVKEVIFNLVVDGNLASFLNFVKSMESSARLLGISSINFQINKKINPSAESVGGTGEQNATQFGIKIKAYSY